MWELTQTVLLSNFCVRIHSNVCLCASSSTPLRFLPRAPGIFGPAYAARVSIVHSGTEVHGTRLDNFEWSV